MLRTDGASEGFEAVISGRWAFLVRIPAGIRRAFEAVLSALGDKTGMRPQAGMKPSSALLLVRPYDLQLVSGG